MDVEMKLTRNLKSSIAFTAPMVSRVPILVERMSWMALSLRDSLIALMSVVSASVSTSSL